MNHQRLLAYGLLTAAGLLGAGALAQLGGLFAPKNDVMNTAGGKAFLEAYQAIQETYLRDVPSERLMKGALVGMIDSLQDEFTYYLEPEVSANQAEELKGEFFGIGVSIVPANKDGTGVLIDTVFPGQPAAGAGLEVGDVIYKVNGEDVSKLTVTQAVRKIRGPRGSSVKLGVLRGVNRLEFVMQRDRIEMINVNSTILPGDLGYVAITDFLNEKVTAQLTQVLSNFKAKKVRGVVLDLRGNPGGLVTQAEGVADAFLGGGDVFIVRDKSKRVRVEYTAKPSASDYLGPLVVMVNSNSASASEIVAAALQENGRAKLVGEQTFGKGVANIPTKLSNGAQVNIAFQEWLTPKRNSIYKKGVTPDFRLEDSRFPRLLALEGINAKPGSQIEIKINGKILKMTANASGRFSYQDEAKRLLSSDRRGKAVADPSRDAELKKALELLGASK